MFEIKNFVISLMDKIEFPENAKPTFIDAIDTITKNENHLLLFKNIITEYDKTENCGYGEMLEKAKGIGKELGVHEYTISLLLFLCLSPKLYERYIKKGLSPDLFYHTLKDLTYKLNECRLLYGIDGSFVAPWFQGFFNLTRFALGRLQFEYYSTRYEYVFNGKTMPVGSKVVNMHIPRTGTKLDHNEVLESYRMAEEMFADKFSPEPVIFLCDSWLLDPEIPSFLRPDSNLTLFQKDFTIVMTGESRVYSALWTVFDREVTGDISVLPADTSLRKAYIERIKNNKPFYYGHGLFLYKNGKIIK